MLNRDLLKDLPAPVEEQTESKTKQLEDALSALIGGETDEAD